MMVRVEKDDVDAYMERANTHQQKHSSVTFQKLKQPIKPQTKT
jgi:hypothetical protein